MHHKVLPSSELRFQTANIWNYIKYDLAKNTKPHYSVVREFVESVQQYQATTAAWNESKYNLANSSKSS